MIVIPNSRVFLLSNIPITNSYEHQMTFGSSTDQTNYFSSKKAFSFTDFTYIREEQAIKIPKGHDALYNCNYIMFQNTEFTGKWFYAFITKKEYVNPNVTKIYFDIDVYQTWQFDMTFKPSFVVREHCQRWNADGSPVVNTVDEELNYGTEYETKWVMQYRPSSGIYYMVVVCKQGMHGEVNKAYYASINGLPQLMVYYVHPFMLDGSTPACDLGDLSGVADFMGVLYTQENAVNNIVSIYVTDCLPNNPIYANGTLSFDDSNYKLATFSGTSVNTVFVDDMDYSSTTFSAGNKYEGYTEVEESKLLMHPYTLVELADLRGNKVSFKNEYIHHSDIMIDISASLGLNNKVIYTMRDYLTDAITDDSLRTKMNLEKSLVNNEPNDMPIMTDLLSAYLQGNRNTIQNQKQSIGFNGAMGILQTGMGAMLGGPFTGQMVAAGVEGAGNALLQAQGLLAKQHDIANTPPSLSKLGSDTYFDFGNKLTGIWIIKKEITDEYRKKLTDFFKMYGYKMNECKIPNLTTRQHFNFVKTAGANIVGNIPQEDLLKIKEMFNNGVTLWHGDFVGDYSLSNGEI